MDGPFLPSSGDNKELENKATPFKRAPVKKAARYLFSVVGPKISRLAMRQQTM